jgi:hypothetical protein
MRATIMADAAGPLTVDPSHIFHVDLVSLDPNVTFTSDGGRSVSAVPEPGTFAFGMLLVGIVLLGRSPRRGERRVAAAA